VQSQAGWNSQAGNNLFFDANIQMLVNAHSNGIHQAWPGRATRDTVPLREVVTDLCVRVGLEAADRDVAQLTDPVRGHSLARQMSIRGGLELLAAAYNFFCVGGGRHQHAGESVNHVSLESAPRLEHRARRLDRRAGNAGAAVGSRLHNVLVGKALQDPPDQRPADAEDLAQRFLAEFGAGRQLLLDNGIVDLRVDDVGVIGHARRNVQSAAIAGTNDSRCLHAFYTKTHCIVHRSPLPSSSARAGDGALRHNEAHALPPHCRRLQGRVRACLGLAG
jgi:hypothetical protein